LDTSIVKELLKRLGVSGRRLKDTSPYPCPLHLQSPTNTLWAVHDGLHGIYLRCINSECMFVGSALELVKQVKGVTTDAALELFPPGDQAGLALFKASGNSQLDKDTFQTRVFEIKRQQEISDYVRSCRKALFERGVHLKVKLESLGIRAATTDHTYCGLVLPNAPSALAKLQDPLYAKQDVLMLPYFHGPCVTHIATYNPLTEERAIFPVSDARHGVFLEREMAWPAVEEVIVCASELDALLATSKLEAVLSARLNLVAVSDPAALLGLGVRKVKLLSHPLRPLTLREVLMYLRVVEGIEGGTLEVVELPAGILPLPHSTLYRLLSKGTPVWEWMVARARSLYASGTELLIDSIINSPLTERDRQKLIGMLDSDADTDLGNIIRHINCSTSDVVIGGERIRRDPQGYLLLGKEEQRLSNFAIYVDKFIDGDKGKINLVGHVKTDVPGEPLYPIEISVDELNTKGSIGAKLWKQLCRFNSQCRFYSASLKNLDWLLLIRAFDNAPHRRSITTLGLTEDRNFNYPNFYINLEDFSLHPAAGAIKIPQEARNLHGAITLVPEYKLDAYKTLFATDDPSAGAFCAAVAHILHGIVGKVKAPNQAVPRHLFFSGSIRDATMWEGIFQQLGRMFSGILRLPTVPNTPDFKNFKDAHKYLGDLPLFCRIGYPNRYVVEWAQSAPHPIIGITEPNIIAAVGKEPNTSLAENDFVVFDQISPAILPEEFLLDLQAAWPYLVQAILKSVTPTGGEVTAEVPAHIGCKWVCDYFDLPMNQQVINLVTFNHTVPHINTPDAFMVSLRKLLNTKATGEQPEYFISKRGMKNSSQDSASLGFYAPDGDVVLWRTRTISAINTYGEFSVFSMDYIGELLVKRGIAANYFAKPGTICWKIPAVTWNQAVDKAPLNFTGIKQPVRLRLVS
jgi:hypothetical protein